MGAATSAASRFIIGILTGIMATCYAVSFVKLVVEPVAPDFVGLAIFCNLIIGVIVTLLSLAQARNPGMVWQAQAIAVVALQTSVVQIGQAMQGATPAAAFATLSAVLTLTAVLSGLGMAAIGVFRISGLGKTVPHPVLGAFMAATGLELVIHALHGAAGAGRSWMAADAVPTWLPLIGIGLAVYVFARVTRIRTLEPVVMIAGAALAALVSPGGSIANSAVIGAQSLPLFAGAIDWHVVLSQVPAAATAAGLSVLAALMNLMSLDRSGMPFDSDNALRWSLPTNLVAAVGSGIVFFPSYALTRLAAGTDARFGRLCTIAIALVPLTLLVIGAQVLTSQPQAFLGFLLVYLGIGILHRWIWVELRRLPRLDALLMLAILGITLTYGFGTGIAVGLLAGSIRFTMAYARLPVVRASYDASLRLSSTERSSEDTRRLIDSGMDTAIVQLTGYQFFGSAPRLEQDLEQAIWRQRRRRVLLDLSAVSGVDISAAEAIQQTIARAEAAGCGVVLCGMSPAVAADLSALASDPARVAPDLDTALWRVEEEVLRQSPAAPAAEGDLVPILDQIAARSPGATDLRRKLSAGEVLFHFGAAADSVAFLEAGRMMATVSRGTSGGNRIAQFLPGALIGEIGILTGGVRSANVVAETDCVVRIISREMIEDLKRSSPEEAVMLLERLGHAVALRLARTTSLLHIYERPPIMDSAKGG